MPEIACFEPPAAPIPNYYQQLEGPPLAGSTSEQSFFEQPSRIEPCPLSEMERHIRQMLADEHTDTVHAGEGWNAVAHRLNPSLSYREFQQFGTFLRHINGNNAIPLKDQVIATRSPEQIDAMVRQRLNRIMIGTERYRY